MEKVNIRGQWMGDNSECLKILPLVSIHVQLLFIEWDKSLRCKYFMAMELAGDLVYLTEDTYNSLKPFLDRFQGTAYV